MGGLNSEVTSPSDSHNFHLFVFGSYKSQPRKGGPCQKKHGVVVRAVFYAHSLRNCFVNFTLGENKLLMKMMNVEMLIFSVFCI